MFFMETRAPLVDGEPDDRGDTDNVELQEEDKVSPPTTPARLDLSNIPPTIPSPKVVKLARSNPTSALSVSPWSKLSKLGAPSNL